MDSLWISFGFHRDWFPLDCLWIPKVFPKDFLWLLCGQQLQNPASFRSRGCSNAFFFEKNGLDSLLLFKRFQNPASCEAGRCRNASFFVVNILWNSWPLPNNFRTQLLFEAGRCSNAAFFNEVLFGFPSSVHTILEPSFLRSRGVRERSFFDETFVGISCRCPAVLESIFFSQQKVAATQLFSRVDGLDSLLLFKLFQNPASFKAGKVQEHIFFDKTFFGIPGFCPAILEPSFVSQQRAAATQLLSKKDGLDSLLPAKRFQNPASSEAGRCRNALLFVNILWNSWPLLSYFTTQLRFAAESCSNAAFFKKRWFGFPSSVQKILEPSFV